MSSQCVDFGVHLIGKPGPAFDRAVAVVAQLMEQSVDESMRLPYKSNFKFSVVEAGGSSLAGGRNCSKEA